MFETLSAQKTVFINTGAGIPCGGAVAALSFHRFPKKGISVNFSNLLPINEKIKCSKKMTANKM
jgi:hypothetical protein